MSDFEFEPVEGLPEALPSGEKIVWQGAPEWRRLAIRVFHVRKVAVYFALLAMWAIATAVEQSQTLLDLGSRLTVLAFWGAGAVGILCGIALLIARSTKYTITTERVVMRFGVAMNVVMQVPFKKIASADVKQYADSSGDLALTLTEPGGLGYVVLWPHARPWRMSQPQPSMRCLPKVHQAASILAKAISARVDGAVPPAKEKFADLVDDPRDIAAPIPAGST